jgi:hypothetical protein
MPTDPFPVDRSRLVTECVDGCVLTDQPHDCCAHVCSECDGEGCVGEGYLGVEWNRCDSGLLWQVC